MLNKIRRVVQKSLAGLLDSGRRTRTRSVDSRNHQEDGREKHDFMQRKAHYQPISVQGPKAKELKTFSEALYFSPSGDVAACRGSLMQCFKAEELTEKPDWAAASCKGRSLKADISAAPSEKPKAAQPPESRRKSC